MQSDQQKRILGYFIEEAQEHLTTIEDSLMNLQQVVNDPEAISEMFRAAHSVKGGAAMLGLHSIQHTAHKLEDYFKILREHPVTVDETLEQLFLQAFDALRELLDELQGPFGLTEETATATLNRVEPVFNQLQAHLSHLTQGTEAAPPVTVPSPPVAEPVKPPVQPVADSSYRLVFQTEVPDRLRAMLQLFKQPDSPQVRQELAEACSNLGQLGETFALPQWVELLAIAQQAVSNTAQPLTALAPVVIKEIMAARDLVLNGKGSAIRPSDSLLMLQPSVIEEAPAVVPEEPEPAVLESAPVTLEEPPQSPEMASEVAPLEVSAPEEEISEPMEPMSSGGDGVTVFGEESGADFQELSDIFSDATALPTDWLEDTLEEDLASLGLGGEAAFDEEISDFLNMTAAEELPEAEPSLDAILDEIEGLSSELVAAEVEEASLDDLTPPAIAESMVEALEAPLTLDSPAEESAAAEPAELALDAFLEQFTEEAPSEMAALDEAVASLEDFLGEVENTEARDLLPLEEDFESPTLSHVAEDVAEFLEEVPGLNDVLENLVVDNAAEEPLAEFIAPPSTDDPWAETLSDAPAIAEPSTPEVTAANIAASEPLVEEVTPAPETVSIAELESLMEESLISPEAATVTESEALAEESLASLEAAGMTAPEVLVEESIPSPEAASMAELEALVNDATVPASRESVLEELEGLIEHSTTSTTPPEAATFNELDQLLEAAAPPPSAFEDLEQLLGQATPAVPTPAPTTTDDSFADLEKLIPQPAGSSAKAATPRRTGAGAKGGSLVEQTMRVPVRHLDTLSNLVGELVVNRNSLEDTQERLRQFLDNLLYQVQQLGDVSQQMQDLYERSLLESSLLGVTTARAANGQGERGTHATGVEFDALEMDRFTGFHTLSQEVIERIVRVREAADDIQYVIDEVEQVARQFRQVTTQVQEGLSRSRMVPFREMSSRLPGAVRRVATTIGKQVELKIEGEDTLIDKGILEKLFDPMTHLINNAVYHGIEPPQVRRQLGKPEKGLIRVRAFYQGSQAIISVSDDGAGIDPERVKRKAIEKGLLKEADAPNLSRQEVYAFLFQSGFSTKDQADALAGRGVGMDVVRKNLEDIRGTINIDSTVGKGTTFTIRLPLTLSITKALCCIDNHCRIAFPIDGVEDMLDIPQERIQTLEDGQRVLSWHDRLLPVRKLGDLLKYSRNISRSNVYGGSTQDDGMVSIVVLRSGDDLVAMEVDQVIGEQEIVIKQLSGPVPKPVGVAGVTVQGDGRAMAIADVLEIIDLSLGRMDRDWRGFGHTVDITEPEEASEPLVLIIDDSITVRELLSMTFTRAGYRVEQARDGQDAWEKLRSGLPCDLVFCDIEMPRMDGLELLSRIQKDPKLNHLPIAMLTSRGADRHRKMAAQLGARGYFTKPYLEEQLLDAAARLLRGEVLVQQEPTPTP
ncbi:response regulator [Thermosynechococcus sp. HN-54]|uniref:hybrid sensor histidine kinase/response regulator n=1 Tax=Thermosynechococcus sp. HN-54 TaxID=2933959 RepID=UPI00202D074F|nr:response regulator [Thermosynechococcus sp. HN-54]URR36118.1 response regulator [Thermosynechococcus sp. HN-54]